MTARVAFLAAAIVGHGSYVDRDPSAAPLMAVVISRSHRGRLPTEAAFARLAGIVPILACSGQTTR